MFQVADQYPADAIQGCDFFSGAAQRKVIDLAPDGTERVRNEMILVADRALSMEDVLEGRIAISEQTVRTMGNMVGLVDPTAADKIARENRRLTAENDQLSAEVVELRSALAARTTSLVSVFFTPDGKQHATEAAAARHMNPTPTAMTPAAPLPEA